MTSAGGPAFEQLIEQDRRSVLPVAQHMAPSVRNDDQIPDLDSDRLFSIQPQPRLAILDY